MADLKDFAGKNKVFKGTAGIIPSDITGVTGDRVNEEGRLRYNNTTNLMEYYNGNDWKPIDSPPVISSLQQSTDGGVSYSTGAAQIIVDRTTSANVIIRINGSLFDTTGATVLFQATSGSNVSPATTTRNSSTQIDITLNAQSLLSANDPYTVKVTNGSGLSAQLGDGVLADSAPVFTNAADTTFTVYDTQRSTYSADCGATDSDSDTITHTISAGSLPSGASINSSTGAVTGADAVGTNTTSTFTVSAATTNQTVTRQFNIAVQAPNISTFTSTGAGTFTAVAGTTIEYIVVGGGGSGGRGPGNQDTGKGGGGAGGMAVGTFTFPSSTPAPDLSIPLTVGAGGSQADYSPGAYGNQGSNSVLTLPSVTVTAFGGGGGGASDNIPGNNNGRPGGSGGGGGGRPSPGTGGSANQGSGTGYTGYGNSGGNAYTTDSNASGGGGGGAGAGGQNGQGNSGSRGGNGGIGRQSDISGTATYYAGGGGGGNNNTSQNATRSSGGSGGGGRGNHGHQANYGAQFPGVGATANTGGGGGGGMDGEPSNQTSGIGGAGGSGIIIVKY